MTQASRETWSSKLGFVLASVGSAIGLGAMWKLPYTMGQNGGGAFILLFIIFNFLIGLPLFIGELLLGRNSQKGVVGSFESSSHQGSSWSFLGWLMVIVVLLILSWYTVVAGWSLVYILLSLSDAFDQLSREEVAASFDLFRESGSLNITFQMIFIGINALILLKGLTRGIERWGKFMTSALFIVLLVLTIYSMQLPGFDQAVHYLLYPDFNKLSPQGVLQALGLALFTLSLAYGAVLTYGSYLKAHEDIPKIASLVVAANIAASVLIALAIFPMIFTFGFAPESGEGLLFKTLPYVLGRLPGSMLLSVIFFSLLFFAALTSSLAMFEVVVANFADQKIMSREKAVWLSAAIVFVLGLPVAVYGEQGIFPTWAKIFKINYLETNDRIVDWILAIIAFFTSIFIAFVMPADQRKKGFDAGTHSSCCYYPWLILMRTAVPIAILAVLLQRAQLFTF